MVPLYGRFLTLRKLRFSGRICFEHLGKKSRQFNSSSVCMRERFYLTWLPLTVRSWIFLCCKSLLHLLTYFPVLNLLFKFSCTTKNKAKSAEGKFVLQSEKHCNRFPKEIVKSPSFEVLRLS